MSRRALAWTAAALALLPRLACGFGDLWLDEIWSLLAAADLDSWTGVFTRFHGNNNHPLNTLILYLAGPGLPAAAYRIHSMAAGAATAGIGALIGARRGHAEAAAASVLAGSSYLLVHYSSEARGYAAAVFFAWLCYWLLERVLEEERPRDAAAFCAAAVLGLLCHLTFLYFYAGSSAWLLVRLRRRGRLTSSEAACALVPALAYAALYVGFYRHVSPVPIGEPAALGPAVLRAACLTLGGPIEGAAVPWLGAAALLAAAAALAALARRDPERAAFFATAALAAPAAAVALVRPGMLSERYFLIPISLLLLLLALFAGRLPVRLRAAALCLFAAANLWHCARLARLGRGSYGAALELMASRTAGDTVSVAGDHDLRVGMTIAYHARGLGKKVAYHERDRQPPEGAEWVVLHSLDPAHAPAEAVGDPRGRRYALAAAFPYAGLSGFSWAVYRRAAAEAP